MWDIIWGLKSEALTDVWTVEHFIAGVSVGRVAQTVNEKMFASGQSEDYPKVRNYIDILFVLFLAYFWETIEHYLETGIAGETVTYWFQGVEYWANRVIFDPLSVLSGYMFYRYYKVLLMPARCFTACWLYVHIFIFPHSMYLHQI